ncbi:hypothetical protein, partial [Methylicorpusculum sp.]|uniref:hypothetical protein n=1 Tax=Methylicorpusculum sp. TaxID=2713644 RepID=UPI002ABBAF7B
MKQINVFLAYGGLLLGLFGVQRFLLTSDTNVVRYTTQQGVGTIATFDALQAGFRISTSPAAFRST